MPKNSPTKSNISIRREDLKKIRDTEFFASNIKNDSGLKTIRL